METEETNPFDDFVYPEQFDKWEERGEELFRVRLPSSVDNILSQIKSFVHWCNEYVPYLKNVALFQDGNRYLIGGTILDDKGKWINKDVYKPDPEDTDIDDWESDIFGYVDIFELIDGYYEPVEVRFFCADKKMESFWGPLVRAIREDYYLDYLKPEIWNLGHGLPDRLDKKMITKKAPPGKTQAMFPHAKPGRKRDVLYDLAFQRTLQGETFDEVYKWYCAATGIKYPDKDFHDSFIAAIKRRQNQA